MGKKYATLTPEGLRVDDEELLAKFQSKMLSASLVTGMLQCPAQYAANSILPKFIEQDLDNAMTRGSLFHRVMEFLFAEDKENRDIARTKELVKNVLAETEFNHFSTNTDALAWLDNAIEGYYAMGSNPKNITIANYKGNGGIEIRLIGSIEGCERQFHGFVDRLSYSKDGGYIIDDWKTGAKTKRYNPKDKYESGWAEARQQILYAYIINSAVDEEDVDNRAKKARLVFPVTGEVVNINVNNESYQKKAIADTVKAEGVYNESCDNNLFAYNKQFLCHWCPLVKACPGAMRRVSASRNAKAYNAYNDQPDIKQLELGLDF